MRAIPQCAIGDLWFPTFNTVIAHTALVLAELRFNPLPKLPIITRQSLQLCPHDARAECNRGQIEQHGQNKAQPLVIAGRRRRIQKQ